ncbi:CEL_1a_G0014760.mRNA.1.CDS.1 [Saccharomyces cerevisiae]|nr:CEL_1a_G0014760.mRNA.1.CDS.1 [Saccharomyces cerevisiae]CAI7256906.1 CEL_1a_G0014760.mRNA.1.CDS.1 [Saccharomyces cerevisiae]
MSSPQAVSSFVRQELAKSIRSRRPYQVNVLIGGYDKRRTNRNYIKLTTWVLKSNYPMVLMVTGVLHSLLLDHHYRPDMTTEEGLDLLKLCVQELEKECQWTSRASLLKSWIKMA